VRNLSDLHNRYHDPALGIFLSVDPLVATTAEPYLCASGNPTTLSDPTGLTPCGPSEEFGCGPIMDKPDRICAVAPNWPGCAHKPPPAEEVQKWVDTCQGGWTYCNQLVTDGGIYDDPAAWQAFSALTILLGLGYLEVQGVGSYQAYLFANTAMLPKGFDNFRVQAGSADGVLTFDVVPVKFSGWSLGITSGYCPLFCLEVGISGKGVYTRTGVGLAFDAPGLTWSNENPDCSTEETTVYANVGIGPVQTAAGWRTGDTTGSWDGFVQLPTVGGDLPRLAKVGPVTAGAGVVHWWTNC
jgi:hypothetical protein